jgi:quinol monooxygenase YgiN
VVTIEYRVHASDADAFRRVMDPVSVTRYRDGAISWMLTRDTENTEIWLEVFVVESWAEHLRQHDRVTKADEEIQSRARGFHQSLPGEGPRPKVRHFVAARHGIATPPAPTPHGHQD